ncbi:MAG: hypothetical protein K6F54_05440 [Lachnospiraceae bacterium]|nr:hypothetical protein [Lachnospiraceae bacterium]
MTRQKKEIIKKIDEIAAFIAADEELGCGFAPAGAYDSAYQEMDNLYEDLAHLRHYKDGNEMMMDMRGVFPDPEIPFP